MRAAIVTVGTELLLGEIVDTNASSIARSLAGAGIDLHTKITVGDNEDRIVRALQIALDQAESVIVTGGLGPTPDDITREAIARVMGTPLGTDPAMADRISAIFSSMTRHMPPNNLRQAEIPEGAAFIEQRLGTAPGLICPVGDKVVYAVPGVPHEMKEMLERSVLPDIVRRTGRTDVLVSRVLRTWGAGESAVAELISDRIEAQKNPTIALLAGPGEINVRLTAKAATEAEARALIEPEERKLRDRLAAIVFGADADTLSSVLGAALKERGLTVAAGESLTGGLVGAQIADTPGASDWYLGSIAAYTAAAKTALLSVPEGVIASHGAVSDECARAMAEGARDAFGSDIGLSCTGEAGPDALEAQVGQVYLAVADAASTVSIGVHLPGDRPRIRRYAAATLLDFARRRLGAAPSQSG